MMKHLTYDEDGNKIFVDSTPESIIAQYRSIDEAIAVTNAWIDEFTAPLTAFAPEQEQKSWPVKTAAAMAYKANTATPAQLKMLGAEAAITGETLNQLTDIILANAEQLEQVSAIVAGLRRSITAGLRAADDPSQYHDILQAGIASAIQKAAELGLDLGG